MPKRACLTLISLLNFDSYFGWGALFDRSVFSVILYVLQTGEARAFYNLANIYQSKGKHMGRLTYNDSRDPNSGEFANEIKDVLLKAIFYYQETLKLVSSKDRAAEGRTYGNLGNTHYLLGDFESAIECHNQRLKIAKEYGDRAAERRAYSNLGIYSGPT